MTRVVIAGGGFAGVAAAREFERLRVPGIDVTLVDRRNFMLFTPMLPEVAAGSVEARHVVQPFRSMLRRTSFELGDITGVDLNARQLTVRHPVTGDTRELSYDELVLALGAESSTMGVPGVQEHAIPLKSLSDAERLHRAVLGVAEVVEKTLDVVERDRLLRFVVVGGSFTGVEAAGELHGFLRSISSYYPALRKHGYEILLIEGGERLLPHLDAKFGKYAAHSLTDRGVRVLVREDVDRVERDCVVLKSGKSFPSRTIVWAAGIKPNPLLEHIGLPRLEKGAAIVDPELSVHGVPHLWAIGDCAAVPKPGGGTYEPLAQNAVHEGPVLARNVTAPFRGRSQEAYRREKLGQMASLGDRQAVGELPRERMVTGLPAWLLWRAYYLSRSPGAANKARVGIDWALGMIFPPRIARLPLVAHRPDGEEEHATAG